MISPERARARWRKRRLIYNNDGDDVIEARPDGVEHEHDVPSRLWCAAPETRCRTFSTPAARP